jgi:hypothetical protein
MTAQEKGWLVAAMLGLYILELGNLFFTSMF